MNSALKTMGARDKTAYRLDHQQRKYEREQDKRKSQDQKKIFQRIGKSIETQAQEVAQPDNQTQEKLKAGLATAIGKAINKISGKDSVNKNAQGGMDGGSISSPIVASPVSTPSPTVAMREQHSDEEVYTRLEALEEKVFSFGDQKKYKGFQSGGFTGAIPNLGQPATGDHFYTHVEPGSYVLNRNAVAAMGFQSGGNVPVALERGEVVIPPGQYDQKVLDILNYSMFPRFQTGGDVKKPKEYKNNGAPSEDNVVPMGMTKEQYKKKQKGGKIFLHWAGSGYSGAHPNYHATVQGDGKVIKTRDYNTFGGGHTYGRNSTGIGISLAAMAGGSDTDFGSYPVKPAQYEGMANLVAKIAKEWGWTPANITINNVMTHAEAGSNRDGAALHDNYGPQPWGGTGERWDLWKLYEDDANGSGGGKIRNMIRSAMGGEPQVEETTQGAAATEQGTRQGGPGQTIPQQQGSKGGGSFTGTGFSGLLSGAFNKVLGEMGGDKFGLTGDILASALTGGSGLGITNIFGSLGSIFGGQPASAAEVPPSQTPNNTQQAPEQSQPSEQGQQPATSAPTVSGRYNKEQLKQLAASVGFPNPNLMAAIAMAESGGKPGIDTKKSGTDPFGRNEYSIGLWQINYKVHKPMLDSMGISESQLRDPKVNARVAKKIYDMQGITAWGAYTNGSYQQHLRRGGQVQRKQVGGMVNMSSKLGNIMQTFMMMNDGELQREATEDMQPSVINIGGDEGEMEQGSHEAITRSNYPDSNLPARDNCPLSIYYRYHPSYNPQGFNP